MSADTGRCRAAGRPGERGFALVAVLLVLALVGPLSAEFAFSMRLEASAARAYKESVAELLQIRGVTPRLFYGAEGTPGLIDLVTVKTPGVVNINTAGPAVLRTMGLADAEISEILQSRRYGPYTDVDRFSGRGLVATTQTFRVEAEAFLDEQPRARLTAVPKPSSPTGPRAGPRSWRFRRSCRVWSSQSRDSRCVCGPVRVFDPKNRSASWRGRSIS